MYPAGKKGKQKANEENIPLAHVCIGRSSNMFFKKRNMVPEWASAMKPKEYALFMSAVEDYFQRKGETFVINDSVVHLADDDWSFGLVNVLQICAQLNSQEYRAVIEHHFGLIIENEAFRKTLDFDDFDKIKQYIGVRLYDLGSATVAGNDATLRRQLAGEVFKVLVYDFPQTIDNIPQSDVDKWGKAEDELFDIGVKNIRNKYLLDWEVMSTDDDEFYIIETEHFFAPNILLELDNREELVGKHGAIIAIPNRHLAIIYPIRDLKVVRMLDFFFSSVPLFFSRGPGSLTQEIYWYRDQRFETLDYQPGKRVRFTPSEAFLALLNDELPE
jgi:hypothetical protein